MKQQGKAAWTLALLSTAFAELVTASTLPLGFFNPLLFLLLLGLYGSGVLLVREFIVRFEKGPASLLAAALAYSVFEEALFLRSWFDPAYPNVQGLGWYGRTAGINTIWALWVTPLLALIAIPIPLLFTGLLYPELRGEPWLSSRQVAFPVAALSADFVIVWTLPHSYTPGPFEYAFAAVLAVGLVTIALLLPAHALELSVRTRPHDRRLFFVFGLLWMGFDFSLYGVGPALGWPPALAGALIAATSAVGFVGLFRMLDPTGWRRELYLFFAGVMAFFALTDLLRGLTRGPLGLASVGVGFLAAAFVLYRETWGAPAPPEAPPPRG